MYINRRPNVKTKMKNHFAFNDHRDIRIECFTDLDIPTCIRDLITLRTGKFKISRNDSGMGKRYFINDYRETHVEPNAVALFSELMLELVEQHDIMPIYSRDDIHIYTIGEYNHPQIKKRLVITPTSVYEEIVKT